MVVEYRAKLVNIEPTSGAFPEMAEGLKLSCRILDRKGRGKKLWRRTMLLFSRGDFPCQWHLSVALPLDGYS